MSGHYERPLNTLSSFKVSTLCDNVCTVEWNKSLGQENAVKTGILEEFRCDEQKYLLGRHFDIFFKSFVCTDFFIRAGKLDLTFRWL